MLNLPGNLLVVVTALPGCQKSLRITTLSFALAIFLSPGASHAQYELEWVGQVNPYNFGSSLNWDPQNIPSAGDRLLFTNNPGGVRINNNLSNLNLKRITFSAGADSFELDGNGIRLTPGTPGDTTLINNSGLTQILDLEQIKVQDFQYWQQTATGGHLLINSDVVLNASLVLDSTINSGFTLAGDISGAGGLVKIGTGDLSLQGVNTYTGGTTINGGTLNITQDNQLGDANGSLILGGGTLRFSGVTDNTSRESKLTAAGGTFDIAGGSVLTHDGLLFDSGSLTKTGNGTLILTQNNSYSGGTFINGGTLQVQSGTFLGAGGPTGDVTFDGGTLNMTSAFNMSRELHLESGGGTLQVSGNFLNQIGLIDGTGGLTKTGAGNLILQANNSFTGGLTVNEGRVSFSNDSKLGATGGELRLDGGTLQLLGTNSSALTERDTILGGDGGSLRVLAGSNLTHNGVISGLGPLIKEGTGTLSLGGSNTYIGDTLIQQGALEITANERLTDTSELTVSAGASFILNDFSETIGGLSGAGTVNLGAGTLTTGLAGREQNFDGLLTGSGSLVKAGADQLTLGNASNDYAGGTTIEAGILSIAADGALGAGGSALTLAGGTLQATDSFTLARNINIVDGSGIEVTDSNVLTTGSGFSIGGPSRLTKTGTGILELAGTLSIADSLVVSDGTVRLAGDERLDNSSVVSLLRPISNGPGGLSESIGTLDLSGFNETIGTLAGAGNITLGGGTLTVAGDTDSLFTGNILGNGNFIKEGDSVLSIDKYFAIPGAQDSEGLQHTGDTIINNGTLRGLTADRFSDQSTVIVNENGTFQTWFEETIGGLGGTGTVIIDGNIYSKSLKVGNNDNNTTFNGTLQGGNQSEFFKVGDGTLVLGGNSTGFSGKVVVESGTLSISSGANLGTGNSNVQLNSSTLQSTSSFTLNRGIEISAGATIDTAAGALTLDDEISGSGGLTKTGAGTLRLNANNTFSGPTNITEGILLTGASQVLNNQTAVTVDTGAQFNIDGNTETIGSLAGSGSVKITTGNLRVGSNHLNTSFSGGIVGSGKLVKLGGGTLTLENNSGFAGTTRIASGVLGISSGTNLGNGSSSLEMAGGTLLTTADMLLDRDIEFFSNSTIDTASGTELTLTGSLVGSGGLIKEGSGTLLLENSVDYAGDTTINNGVIRTIVSNILSDNSGIITATGSLLDMNNLSDTIGSLAGSGNVQLGAGTLRVGANDEDSSFSGRITSNDSALLVKMGTGTFTLNGNLLYSGDVRLEGGTLSIGSETNLGTGVSDLQFAGGTLETTSDMSLSRGAFIESTGSFSTADNTVLTIGQTVSGAGGLIKTGAGELRLLGNNSYLGGTTIAEGVLTIESDANLGDALGNLNFEGGSLQTNSTLSLNRSTVLGAGGGNFQTADGTVLTLTGLISGAGNLTKSGDGELVLSAAGNSANNLNVSAGTFTVASGAGSITTNSTVLSGGILQSDTVRVSDTGTAAYSTNTLSGKGEVKADISGDGMITASSGTLVLGNSASATGFDFDGILKVNNNRTAILNSATQASLGGQTILNNGTLNSNNGIELEAGATLEGDGTVKGSFVNQGTVVGGNGPGIVFKGDVSTTGDFFGASTFDGTLRAGINGPAQVSFEQMILNGVLEMEIGGTTPGTGYDQFVGHSHLQTFAGLRGELNVNLLGTSSYVPAFGDFFDLIIADIISESFSAINLPGLMNGLFFDFGVVELDDGRDAFRVWVAGTDASVPEPESIVLLAFGLLILVRFRYTINQRDAISLEV